jgi:hypothetical protein
MRRKESNGGDIIFYKQQKEKNLCALVPKRFKRRFGFLIPSCQVRVKVSTIGDDFVGAGGLEEVQYTRQDTC